MGRSRHPRQRAQHVQRHKGLLCVWFALVDIGRSGRWWNEAGERKVLQSWVLVNPGECEVGGGGIQAHCLFTLYPRDHGQTSAGM